MKNVRILSMLFALLITQVSNGQGVEYYWVGNSGSWSDVSHWATTSGGSVFHSQPPTENDDVFFDANSFTTGSQTVFTNPAAFCRSMDWTGVTNTPSFQIFDELSVSGSLTFDAGMTLSGINLIRFTSEASGNNIATAGLIPPGVSFEGTGDWTLQDDLNVSFSISLVEGTLNANGHAMTSNIFTAEGDLVRHLSLGSSTVTCVSWDVSNSTNLTIDPGTSLLSITSSFIGGGYTYNDLTLDGENVNLFNSNTLGTLTLTAGTMAFLEEGETQTVSDLQAIGDCGNVINLQTTSAEVPAIISMSTGTVNLDYVKIAGITAQGGAVFNATNSIDGGNNSGWNITGGTTYYWIGNSGNWSDETHWSLSSGGSSGGCVPNQTDDVVFDANSFSMGSRAVTIDGPADCKSMDWTGVTNAPTLDISNDLSISGSLTLDAGMTLDGNGTIRFTSSGSGNTITTAGLIIPNISFEGSGDWALQDNLDGNSSITLHEGTFTTNNNNLISSYFYFSDGTSTRQLNLGGSTATINFFDVSSPANLTIDAGTSSITITSTFVGGGFTYHDVFLDGVWIGVNGSNTFNLFSVAAGTIVSLEENKTQTFNDLQATGDCGNITFFRSTSDGIVANFVQASGTVDLEFVELQDINASGGATFNATNSIDGSNNSGWNISPLPGTTYYWINDGGNWNDTGHWSLSSGGSSSGCLPTRYDNVVFDANSFSTTDQAATVNDLNANCHSMDWTGVTNTPDLAGSRDLDIYGSLTLVPDMTVSYGGIIDLNFKSGNTGNTITTAGHQVDCYVHLDGSGEWTMQDDIVYARRFYLDQGSLITNGFDITTTNFYSTTGLTRQLTLGNSTITCGTQWNLFDETNLTLNAGTSTIVQGSSGTFYGANLTYHNVEMTTSQSINILGSNTFNEFSVTNSSKIEIAQETTQTLNTLSIPPGSGCTDFFTIRSSVAGLTASIAMSSGSFNGDHLIIRDVIATGGGIFNATNSIGVGVVTGWNITEFIGQDFYWIGGTGSWNDTGNWSLTSGGAPGTCLPSLNDNVYFDASSFTGTDQFVNMNGTAYCKSMDWTGALFNPEMSGGGNLQVNGSLVLIPAMTMDYPGAITFLSSEEGNTVNTGGHSLSNSLNFHGSGEYALQGDLETSGKINFLQGTMITNSHDVSLGGNFDSFYTLSRSLDLGNSRITLDSWNIDNPTNLTFDAGTSEIIFSTGGGLFSGAGLIYHDVTLGGPGPVFISGSNTFNILSAEPGVALTFEEETIQTFNRILTRGTELLPSSLQSGEEGVPATISQSTPNFCGDYLSIQDIMATGGAPFFAGANSTDLGGNSGWTFSDCVKPTIDAGDDATICFGESVAIGGAPTASGATSPYTYSWTPTDGLDDSTVANPVATPTTTTTYMVTVTDDLSAQNSDAVTITVNPLPPANAGSDVAICEGESSQLNATGANSYSWSPAASLNNSAIADPIASPLETTIYTVTVTDDNNCMATDEVMVTINEVNANAGPDATICFGSSVILDGSGGLTYSWSPSFTLDVPSLENPVASPSITTEYTLTASNGTCSDTDNVTVTVNPLPTADAGVDRFVCEEEVITIGGNTTASGGTAPYTYFWTPADQVNNNTVANPSVATTSTQEFEVAVQDANGCTDSDMVKVTVNPLPIADAGADKTICAGESIVLGGTITASLGTPPYSYSWLPVEGIDDPTLAKPLSIPEKTTTYSVTVTDSKQCTATDIINLTVDASVVQAGFIFLQSEGRTIEFSDTSRDHSGWSWDFGDGSTSDLQHPSHTYTENGMYEVCLTATGECNEDVVCETISVAVTGIDNSVSPHGLEIYPNPAKNEVNLKIDRTRLMKAEIVIYSISGHEIYRNFIDQYLPGNAFKIETPDWPNGMYTVQVRNSDLILTERLIIDKN